MNNLVAEDRFRGYIDYVTIYREICQVSYVRRNRIPKRLTIKLNRKVYHSGQCCVSLKIDYPLWTDVS